MRAGSLAAKGANAPTGTRSIGASTVVGCRRDANRVTSAGAARVAHADASLTAATATATRAVSAIGTHRAIGWLVALAIIGVLARVRTFATATSATATARAVGLIGTRLAVGWLVALTIIGVLAAVVGRPRRRAAVGHIGALHAVGWLIAKPVICPLARIVGRLWGRHVWVIWRLIRLRTVRSGSLFAAGIVIIGCDIGLATGA